MFCARDDYDFLGGGEEYMKLGGGGHTLYGADKRGGEVKTKPEMKRPYWVRSSSIAWSLIICGNLLILPKIPPWQPSLDLN